MTDNLIPSIIGTLTAEILTLPICTIKTVYQNNNSLTINQTIKLIFNKSGYKGFIQASCPAILSQVISTSTKFSFYNFIKEKRKTESTNIMSNSINGIFGGICGSVFSHPIDVWKNYVQRNEKFKWKKFNINLYYQGYTATIYKNTVLYASLFPIYDYFKEKFNSIYLSSICTTLIVSTIIQPFDYYKTVKIAGNSKLIKTIGLKNFFGLKNFTRGYSLMLLRSLPHFLLTMTITEKLKKYF